MITHVLAVKNLSMVSGNRLHTSIGMKYVMGVKVNFLLDVVMHVSVRMMISGTVVRNANSHCAQ